MLREPGLVTVVDVRDAFGDVAARVSEVRGRASALLGEFFFGEVTWQHDVNWRFWAPALSLRSVVGQLANKRAVEGAWASLAPQERYQRAVERLRALCGGDLSSHSRPFAEARAHLAEVLGEGIPGLIDLHRVRFCSDAPCDVLRAEGDIIDENGAVLLRKGECFAVERGAAAEGALARVKLTWWDESGTYRNEFALALQPAAVVGECRDANLKDACAARRPK